jgi:EpsI family protein
MNSIAVRILSVVLLLQAAAYYAVASRSERIPEIAPLATFPQRSGRWTTEREFPLEKEVQDALKADDSLNRLYVNAERTVGVSLFIAFFKTQRYGQSPHSPKNCLPGAGWQPSEDSQLQLMVPGREVPIVINKYVIARGEERSVVLYWYQSRNRVIAGEFAARFWLVADAIRFHRSDTALVRVIAPVVGSNSVHNAENTAVEFVRAVYPEVARQFSE